MKGTLPSSVTIACLGLLAAIRLAAVSASSGTSGCVTLSGSAGSRTLDGRGAVAGEVVCGDIDALESGEEVRMTTEDGREVDVDSSIVVADVGGAGGAAPAAAKPTPARGPIPLSYESLSTESLTGEDSSCGIPTDVAVLSAGVPPPRDPASLGIILPGAASEHSSNNVVMAMLPHESHRGGRGPASVGFAGGFGGGNGGGSPVGSVDDQEAPNPPTRVAASSVMPTTYESVSRIADAVKISQSAGADALVRSATNMRRQISASAEQDHRVLGAAVESLPMDALNEHLSRAKTSLNGFASDLAASTGGTLDTGERARFKNLFLNAADKAALGSQAIEEERAARRAQDGTSLFSTLFRGPASATTPESGLAARFLGTGDTSSATSNDALVNRLIMFNGLPPSQRDAFFRRLKLAENAKIQLGNGEERAIPILHNGYIFGGSATSVDCSSFVSAVLPADVRKGRFTTLDFRAMYVFRRSGMFPRPPIYDTKRAALVRRTAEAFSPVNLYAGENLRVGDILVYRLSSTADGHVFIVRSYDPTTLVAQVIEASQSAGTVRERELALSIDPLSAPRRTLRRGLFALRIRPVNNRACTYRDHAVPPPPAQPAPGPAPGLNQGGART